MVNQIEFGPCSLDYGLFTDTKSLTEPDQVENLLCPKDESLLEVSGKIGTTEFERDQK